MGRLRGDVFQADKSGHGIQQALDNLQAYVTSNMNTNLTGGSNAIYPPIQLEYTYQRLLAAQDKTIQSANTGLYTSAQEYCQKLDPTDFSGHNRVPCIEQYVTSHGYNLQSVPKSLYEFDFVSPTWSPDLAGWTLLASITSLCFTLLLFAYHYFQKHFSKKIHPL